MDTSPRGLRFSAFLEIRQFDRILARTSGVAHTMIARLTISVVEGQRRGRGSSRTVVIGPNSGNFGDTASRRAPEML
jgi:hypothetical protein